MFRTIHIGNCDIAAEYRRSVTSPLRLSVTGSESTHRPQNSTVQFGNLTFGASGSSPPARSPHRRWPLQTDSIGRRAEPVAGGRCLARIVKPRELGLFSQVISGCSMTRPRLVASAIPRERQSRGNRRPSAAALRTRQGASKSARSGAVLSSFRSFLSPFCQIRLAHRRQPAAIAHRRCRARTCHAHLFGTFLDGFSVGKRYRPNGWSAALG